MAGTGIYGELLKAQLENLSSDPASTSVGRVYWNTTTQSPRVYTSSGWDDLGSAGSSSGRNYLSDWFDSYKVESVGTSAATSTGNRTVAGNTDPTKWVTSDLTNLTFTRSADTTLRQSYNYLINSGDANADFVESPLFTLDGVDLGKPVMVRFDCAGVSASDDYQVCAVRYNSSGTYQEVITIAGTASATSPYSARIPTGTTSFSGFFIAGSTASDQYAIRFMKHAVNVDLRIDSLYVGPEKVVQGAGITDWVSYTPTNSNSTNATTAVHYRRVGDSLELLGRVSWYGAGSGSTMTLTLPTGLTVDSSKIAGGSSTDVYFGPGQFFDSGTAVTQISVYYASSTTIGFWFSSANVSFDGSQGASGDVLTFNARIPISGWSSNITMADREVEEYYSVSDSWTSSGSATQKGMAGGAITGALAGVVTKTITPDGPLLASDRVDLEFSSDRIAWQSSGMASLAGYPILRQYSSGAVEASSSGYYVTVSSTSIAVTFFRYMAIANDDSPTVDWQNNTYWRIRVTRGGAAVGYPIGAENIVVPNVDRATSTTTYQSNAIESGTYTPTVANGTNCSALVLQKATYQRVGKFVTVQAYINIATTAATPTASSFTITLPIASNLSLTWDLIGSGTRYRASAGAMEAVTIEAAVADDKAIAYFTAGATASASTTITFTYEIK